MDTETNIAVATESKLTARATLRYSLSMKYIVMMTMLFLPATFFATLFAMPTLQWDSKVHVHRQFWIYVVCSLLATSLGMAMSTAEMHGTKEYIALSPKPRAHPMQCLMIQSPIRLCSNCFHTQFTLLLPIIVDSYTGNNSPHTDKSYPDSANTLLHSLP